MKKIFLLLLFLFFSFPVLAQTYTISAQQLQRLETVLANYKISRQQALSLAKESQNQAKLSSKQVESLSNSLLSEREKIKSLNELLTKSENQQTLYQAQIASCKTEISDLKIMVQKKNNTIITLSSVIMILTLIIGGYIAFKILK